MTGDTTENKRLAHGFASAVRNATPETAAELVAEYYRDDADWHGPAPIDRLDGQAAIAEGFWEPLLASFPDIEQNDHILFGGEFEGEQWVCATGNLVGTFEEEWVGIPPTGHATWLRYGAFHRFDGGDIVETRVLIDVLDVMRQAGYEFVPALAPEVVVPGPTTHDGLLLDAQDDAESDRTLQLVEDMLFDWLHSVDALSFEDTRAGEYWQEDFMWYGPAGTGTTRGIEGFLKFHQGPFQRGFPDFQGGNHVARFAEGHYCGSTGWPSLRATHTGPKWLGLPATGESVGMRIIDVWRRAGDLLAENWVFIDMIDLLAQIGVDVFDRLENDQQYF